VPGSGVPEDDKTAAKWWKLAAEQGNANAQSNLGGMYCNGQGVIQDNVYAHMWFNIAASSGDSENASGNRDIVAKQMTTSQIKMPNDLPLNVSVRNTKGVE
jgi:TPR repeat protein